VGDERKHILLAAATMNVEDKEARLSGTGGFDNDHVRSLIFLFRSN